MNQHKPTLADVIVLGAAQFGMDYGITNVSGKPSNQEIFKIPECAWEIGVRRFDTAPGCGTEVLLGEFIRINELERDAIVLRKVSGLHGNDSHRTKISQSLELFKRN